MYGIYKYSTNNSAPTLIAVCRSKLSAASACRHFYDIYMEETGRVPYRITYHKVESYWRVRLNYYILRVVRGMESSKLERLRAAEQKATTKRASQEEILASLY